MGNQYVSLIRGAGLAVGLMALSLGQSSFSQSSSGSITQTEDQSRSNFMERFGMNYFSFFDGPGLDPDNRNITPNSFGRPFDDGLSFFNLISVKYKLNSRYSLDFQTRTRLVLNNAQDINDFQALRWESPRIGISGVLAKGSDWVISGAVNSDFPYMLPSPLGGGFTVTNRTTLASPGMFGSISYNPKDSRFSFFGLLSPRMFIYQDRNAAEPQLARSGLGAAAKPEFVLSFSPSVDYALTPSTGLRVGTTIDYRKLVGSSWNPMNASINQTDASNSWKLWAMPLSLGITHSFSKALNIYPFITSYPIAAQRIGRNGSQASFAETLSVGMWISGVIF